MPSPTRSAALHRALPVWSVAAALLLAACHGPDSARLPDSVDIPAFDTTSVRVVADTTPRPAPSTPPHPTRKLSPLADSIGDQLVFMVRERTWLIAASRHKHMLLDLGRVDAKLKTRAQLAAFREAVSALSPVQVGDRFRLHGQWGSDDAAVTGFDRWNGRIVATLQVPRTVDSLARRKEPLIAAATRADSASPGVADSCRRDSVAAALAPRLPALRDSLARTLRGDTLHLPERLRRAVRVQSSEVVGCFGPWRMLLFVVLSAGGYEYTHEIALLLDASGRAQPVRVSDLRFHAHEALHAMDVDGDGVDDVALRGRGVRMGGTSILRLDPEKRRLEYVTGGFAWETY